MKFLQKKRLNILVLYCAFSIKHWKNWHLRKKHLRTLFGMRTEMLTKATQVGHHDNLSAAIPYQDRFCRSPQALNSCLIWPLVWCVTSHRKSLVWQPIQLSTLNYVTALHFVDQKAQISGENVLKFALKIIWRWGMIILYMFHKHNLRENILWWRIFYPNHS